MSDSSKSTSMAELMAKHQSAFHVLKKGDHIKATVTRVTPQEMYVQLESNKTEALALEKDKQLFKEQQALVKTGDTVEVTVISPENEMGVPVVSLRHFVEQKFWNEIERLQKSQEKMPVLVKEAIKGGFLVEGMSGMHGFLPNSHISVGEDTNALAGKTINASIVDSNKEQKKIIFSQKGILTTEDFKKAASGLTKGAKVKGVISGITTFGLFVSLPEITAFPVEGLIHISEVSWEKVDDLNKLFELGQKVEAVVVGVDADAKRIDLSLKRLTEDPFAQIEEQFPIDKKVAAVVTKVDESGVMLELGKVGEITVEGMIKREKIAPNTTYEVGQKVNVTVSQIDQKRRKIYVTPVLLEKPLMYR